MQGGEIDVKHHPLRFGDDSPLRTLPTLGIAVRHPPPVMSFPSTHPVHTSAPCLPALGSAVRHPPPGDELPLHTSCPHTCTLPARSRVSCTAPPPR